MRFNFDLPEPQEQKPVKSASATPSKPKEGRFNFDLPEPQEQLPVKSPSALPSKPKEELEWLPLQDHPVFNTDSTTSTSVGGESSSSLNRMARNLMAWDGASRLYYWDSDKECLHRISIRLGEPDEHSIFAASPSKVLRPDMKLKFDVSKIYLNVNGSVLLLIGSDGICIMYIYGRTSTMDSSMVCRTLSVGSEICWDSNDGIRLLQAIWHPYSNSHIGVLSSDSVFRIFDVSSDPQQPEQEYYLQPVEHGRSQVAASICPADFSFGCDHLWDRFSVFILFSDGSIYILCPVAPFGSVYKWEGILELYGDAQAFGMKSSNMTAVKNSHLAISWLEATFPELNQKGKQIGSPSTVKAYPYAIIDASLLLQGPLCKVCQSGEEEHRGLHVAECEGRAVSLLYNSVGKDSVLVTAWSGGQLQIDALADEIQPLWNIGNPPRLSVDSHDKIVGFAMISDAISEQSLVRLDHPLDNSDWLGHPPPYLRLAIVDLALPKSTESNSLVSLFIDPLISESIYALHDGGVDSIVLHFLPFTSQSHCEDETLRIPSVKPVLNTYEGLMASSSSLCSFVILADSFGSSWIAGVTSGRECIVLEMKTWSVLVPADIKKITISTEEQKEGDLPNIINRELLSGPKMVILPQASNLRSVASDSIEGRSALLQYCKLFHENYMGYAHKVFFELQHHGTHLKRIIDNLHTRLHEAQQKLQGVEAKQPKLDERIEHALQFHNSIEERLQRLKKLPGVHKRPLSRAELNFKAEIDGFRGVELDSLHSSIQALNARLRRHYQSPKRNAPNVQRASTAWRNSVQDTQLAQLRAALGKLSLVNSENTKKVKQVESALKSLEERDTLTTETFCMTASLETQFRLSPKGT